MNNGDFITSLAKTTGVPEDNEHFVAIMANKELATAEFPDELASLFQSKLLTFESAKNNSELNKHFKAESLNAVDGKLNELAEKYELGEELINTMKGTQGTYNRMDFFGENLVKSFEKKIEEAKNTTDDPKAKERLEELQTQVNTLNGDMATFKDTHMLISEFDDMRDGYEEMILEGGLKSMLGNYTYANKEVDKTVNVTMASTLLSQALTEKGVKVVNKEGILTLEKTDGTEYFEDNQKVELKGFVESTLAHYKLLQTTEPATPPAPNGLSTEPVKVADNAPKGLEEGLRQMRESNDAAIAQLIPKTI